MLNVLTLSVRLLIRINLPEKLPRRFLSYFYKRMLTIIGYFVCVFNEGYHFHASSSAMLKERHYSGHDLIYEHQIANNTIAHKV